jgi:hypothetical protein
VRVVGSIMLRRLSQGGSWTLHSSTSSVEINREKDCATTFTEYWSECVMQ